MYGKHPAVSGRQAYLASSSGEEDDEGAAALKALVGGDGEDSDDDGESDDEGKSGVMGDMEATFSVKAMQLEQELQEKAKKLGPGAKVLKPDEPQSAWEKFLEKKKQTRRERKAQAKAARDARKQADAAPDEVDEEKIRGDLELLAADEGLGAERGFNLRGPQRGAHRGVTKRQTKADAEGSFHIDAEDPRISKVFNGEDFEIDPTNPEFRPSEGMKELLRKKRQRAPAKKKAPVEEAPAPAAAPRQKELQAEKSGGLQLFARKPKNPVQAPAAKRPRRA